ncbi:hypothetical protein GJ496_000737 [Pomphorhynchus laevis]|nr:hypothetical protein GJ496_000737 [Pomphorhynchus laevis]
MFDQIHSQRKLPFSLLCFEKVSYDDFLGNDLRGRIVLTNFRVFAKPVDEKSLFYNVPMRLIDYCSNPENCSLKIYCRHGFAFCLTFPTNSRASDAYRICTEILTHDTTRFKIEYTMVSVPNQNTIALCDYKRLGLTSGSFQVTTVNKGRRLCETYPEYCSIPANIINTDLVRAAEFRANNRFVAIVYRHNPNGVCLARCAQPTIGIMCTRNIYDERILKAIGDSKNQQLSGNQSSCPLYIVDARDSTSAYLNRARGGGYEYEEYYVGSKIHFMHIPNIHYVRSALNTMRDVILDSNPSVSSVKEKFHSLDWSKYISIIIMSVGFVIDSIHNQGIPVLVHCSDGWDRTPQIVSLSKLCLDPYYRTIKGFCVLVETEWIAFGHQFSLRCNSEKDCKERSPVFLQFLDCVYQLLQLYPTFFEFNQNLLCKIGLHCYLNFFENFSNSPSQLSDLLLNNEDICCSVSSDLVELRFAERRQSIWSFILGNISFKNPCYNCNQTNYQVR